MSEEKGESKAVVEEEKEEGEGSAGQDLVSERNAQCYEMFEKVAEYLNGELAGRKFPLLS